jgi:hypothetical protein
MLGIGRWGSGRGTTYFECIFQKQRELVFGSQDILSTLGFLGRLVRKR